MFAIANGDCYDSSSHLFLTTSPLDCILSIEEPAGHDDPISYYNSLPSPRLLATHIPYTSLPDSFLINGVDSGPGVVYIARNPRDVILISLWKFSRDGRSIICNDLPTIGIEEAFELFCKGISFAGSFWDHVLGYWKASLENPNKVLFLKYEDMKMDPECCVKKLAEFMGQPFSLQEVTSQGVGVVQEIIQLCSFKNLTSLEVNKILGYKSFFRKGEVGDSKNYLTSEMFKRLDEITYRRNLDHLV